MSPSAPDSLFDGSAAKNDPSLPNVLKGHLWSIADGEREFDIHLNRPLRVLILYGSLREHSYSRLLAEEAIRLLETMGAEVHMFDPRQLPLPGDDTSEHPIVKDLQRLSLWSDAHVWVSPEQHGLVSSVLKLQLEHLPLKSEEMSPTQGRTLAVMQVNGGEQSFNCLNQMRVLGRWLHMFAIPRQVCIPKAWTEFDDNGRMKPSEIYDRVVDVMEELLKITLLMQGRTEWFLDRYSDRKAR